MDTNRDSRKNPSPIQFPCLRGGKQPAARSKQPPSTLAFLIDLRANRISERRLSILQQAPTQKSENPAIGPDRTYAQ